MSLITKPYTWTVGSLIIASEHNAVADTIYNDYNGNITNANISGSAAIADSKLAQITTTSKVSGAALTSLASVPSSAGFVPIANIPSILQATSATRDISLSAGTQSIVMSGTSFTPNSAIILASVNNTNKASWGMNDISRSFCISSSGTSRYVVDSSYSIKAITVSGTTEYKGSFTSFNSTGGVITWVRVGGTTTGTLQLYVGFMK